MGWDGAAQRSCAPGSERSAAKMAWATARLGSSDGSAPGSRSAKSLVLSAALRSPHSAVALCSEGGDGEFERYRCGAWLHPAAPGRSDSPLCPPREKSCPVVPGAGSIPGSLSVLPTLPAAFLCRGTPCNPSASPQVLSGCAIIVRGQPRGGPPPERQINLSNIRAGNLARRAAAGQPDAKDTPDEVSASRQRCRAAPALPRGPRAELDGGPTRLLPPTPTPRTAAPLAGPLQEASSVPLPGPLLASRGVQAGPPSPVLSPAQLGDTQGAVAAERRMKQSLQSSFKRSFPCSVPPVWILGRNSPVSPRCGHTRGQDGAGVDCERGAGAAGQVLQDQGKLVVPPSL